MKNKLFITSLLTSVVLAGCGLEEQTIMYEGKEHPISEVEEIMADQLEVENPSLDLEVSVFEESED